MLILKDRDLRSLSGGDRGGENLVYTYDIYAPGGKLLDEFTSRTLDLSKQDTALLNAAALNDHGLVLNITVSNP